MLQLCRSGRISWADMVLAPSVAGLFKWRQFELALNFPVAHISLPAVPIM